jgi:DNA-directed RNA polymerase alpha subunit
MSQFFISCKESIIENNRSFYGCFNLGPFEPSQSITIANALRRTLLSELYGLSIISVEIEGATHEYSNLSGVKDSVLDILLNLKEIILKKSINPLNNSPGHEGLLKPQIGYLKARGPGIVRASNLRLPPFLQCVDPDQYIATLAQDGFLNMKFIIKYGNKWASSQNSNTQSNQRGGVSPTGTKLDMGLSTNRASEGFKDPLEKEENLYDLARHSEGSFNLHLKKRRLILKKLRHIGLKFSNSYINMLTQKPFPNSLDGNKPTAARLLSIFSQSESETYKKENQLAPCPPAGMELAKLNQNSFLEKKAYSGRLPSELENPKSILGFLRRLSLKKKISIPLNLIKTEPSMKVSNFVSPWIMKSESDFISRSDASILSNLAIVKKSSQKYPGINLRKKNKLIQFNKILKKNTHSFLKKSGVGSLPLESIFLRQLRVNGNYRNAKNIALILKKRIFNKINLSLKQHEKQDNVFTSSASGLRDNPQSLINLNPSLFFAPLALEKNPLGSLSFLKKKKKNLEKFPASLGIYTNLNSNSFFKKSGLFLNSSPLTIDAIFNPITKVNYIIEVNDYKATQTSFDTSLDTLELFEILNLSNTSMISGDLSSKKSLISNTNFKTLEKNTHSGSLSSGLGSLPLENIFLRQLQGEFSSNEKTSPVHLKTSSSMQALKTSLENILKIKREINSLKKETPKHNIILEIWTNGSMHPRDAIYEGLKNLVKLFSKLNKINAFMINPFIFNSLSQNKSFKDSNLKITESKKIKQAGGLTSFTDSSDLLPLNDTSFLSTYMSPKVKKYYKEILNKSPKDIYNKNFFKNKLDSFKKESPSLKDKSEKDLEISNFSIKESTINKKLVLGDFDLGILNLSLRSYTCLKRLNINSINELINFLKNNSSSSSFSSTEKNSELKAEKTVSVSQTKLSKSCLKEIERSLKKINISLKK